MTQRQSIEGRGGSFTVGDEVKPNKGSGTLNPGDPGYQDAVRKTPLKDAERKGTLNRAPTFRDLDEATQADKAAQATKAAKTQAEPTNQGGKR